MAEPPSYPGTTAQENNRRVTWTLFMLDRVYSTSLTLSPSLADRHFRLALPSAEESNSNTGIMSGQSLQAYVEADEDVDLGILPCVVRLFSLWGLVTEYACKNSDKASIPPWQSNSDVANLEAKLFQYETHFPKAHRYGDVNFSQRATEEPQSRGYLIIWLYAQFMYHSIESLIHHPFIMLTKLHSIKGRVSEYFLQKSYESSLIHSRWIVRFVRDMREAKFNVYDPFLGYLAAIAGTIQLELMRSKYEQISVQATEDFQTVLEFIATLSMYWTNMKRLVSFSFFSQSHLKR